MRIAIFGGSFDPIHIGHLSIAEDARTSFGYDRILFFPSNIPPHKRPSQKVSAQARVQMTKLAIEGNESFAIDEYEVRTGGISYTIDTIHHVMDSYDVTGKPGLIIGEDLLPGFHTWKDAEHIQKLVELLVARRSLSPGQSGEGAGTAPSPSVQYEVVQNVLLPVSSSEIRKRVGSRLSFRYLVPESVYAYISENELYAE